MKKALVNGRLVTPHGILEGSALVLENDCIESIIHAEKLPAGVDIVDCEGNYIMPGFVDLHTHGSGGFDFMDGSAEDIKGAARSLAVHGTTTCLPTTLTCSDEDLLIFFRNFREVRSSSGCAKMPGAHLEGPYFDMVEKGAQDPRFIRDPSPEHYETILEAGAGLIRRWSVAPERPGAMQFIDRMVKHGIVVSAAHTAATYDIISEAYDHGLNLLTHFYSGMSTITRRGGFRVLGAVESGYLLDGMNIELICDGSHLPPELLKMIFKLKDHRRIIACSDSMRGAGMPDGPSVLGPKNNGTACIIEDGIAKMPDRTCFAGSVATGDRLARTLHKILGLGMEEVSRILCTQPAAIIGMDGQIGSIEKGKKADLVVCDDDISIKQVYLDGNVVL